MLFLATINKALLPPSLSTSPKLVAELEGPAICWQSRFRSQKAAKMLRTGVLALILPVERKSYLRARSLPATVLQDPGQHRQSHDTPVVTRTLPSTALASCGVGLKAGSAIDNSKPHNLTKKFFLLLIAAPICTEITHTFSRTAGLAILIRCS